MEKDPVGNYHVGWVTEMQWNNIGFFDYGADDGGGGGGGGQGSASGNYSNIMGMTSASVLSQMRFGERFARNKEGIYGFWSRYNFNPSDKGYNNAEATDNLLTEVSVGAGRTWTEFQGGGSNIWGEIGNSFLVGAAANQPTYFRSSQIAKEGEFAVDGWKTYSNLFRGNQYVSSATIKEAKAAFNSVAKTASRISTGLSLAGIGITYANHAAGNTSDGRYYVQQAINIIGLFGPWGAGISIGLGSVDAIWGDEIEAFIRK